MLELLERVESMAETVDVEWVGGASKCGEDALEELGSVLATVSEVQGGSGADG